MGLLVGINVLVVVTVLVVCECNRGADYHGLMVAPFGSV